MAKITSVEALMVDLVPKVKRTDAIQSFISQETPILRITDADGLVGTGYSYTIGTGGPAIMSLLQRTLAPALIGREASKIEQIWHDLLFLTHATSVGAITSLALAAVDTALWDLKCRRANEPLHRMAGGAQSRIPLYTTEGGWLHIDTPELVEDALRAQAAGFGGSKIKIGRPHVSEDVARLTAVRDAVGPAFEIMTDANQRFTVDEAIRRAKAYAKAGADMIFPEFPNSDIDMPKRFAAEVHKEFPDLPLYFNYSSNLKWYESGVTFDDIANIGFKLMHVSLAGLRTSMQGMFEYAADLKARGAVAEIEYEKKLINHPMGTSFEFAGFPKIMALEEKYLPADELKKKYQ